MRLAITRVFLGHRTITDDVLAARDRRSARHATLRISILKPEYAGSDVGRHMLDLSDFAG